MNVHDLTYLISKPDAINGRQTIELETVLEQFPYFQPARALHLKGLYNQNSFRYNQELKKTAAYTTDRSVLFEFITSEGFVSIQKAFLEEKEAAINDIIVHQYKIVVSDKIEVQPKANPLEQSILSSIQIAEPEVQKEMKNPLAKNGKKRKDQIMHLWKTVQLVKKKWKSANRRIFPKKKNICFKNGFS